MGNEEKKEVGRFFFSSELDRGESNDTSRFSAPPKEEKPVEEKEEKKENNKPATPKSKRNNKRSNRKGKGRNNSKKKNTPETDANKMLKDALLEVIQKRGHEAIPHHESITHDSDLIEVDDSLRDALLEVILKRNKGASVPEIEDTLELDDDFRKALLAAIEKNKQKNNKRPEEEAVPPMVDFEVFGSDEEEEEETEVLDEKKPLIIPYKDELSTVPNEKPAFEDEVTALREKGIHVADARDIDLDHTLYRDQFFIPTEDQKDDVVEEVKEALETNPENNTGEPVTIRKVYLSFQARVLLLTIGVLVLFGLACYIIVSTLQNNNVQKVNYLENTTIHYDVCQASTDPYNEVCLKEGNTYHADNTGKIHVDYHYEAKFKEDVSYDMSYHVVVVNKIYDHTDSSRVSYEDEDLLIDKKEIPYNGNPATMDVRVDIDFTKYQSFITEYKNKYSSNVDGVLNVILFVDDGEETRNVGEVDIPLGMNDFQISAKGITDSKQVYLLVAKDWTNTNTLYIIVGSVFVLLSLFLLFHLTKLALSVTGKKSKYQEVLMNILNEYDRLIVIARDGYESADQKRIIKVYTFQELLDARNVLNKPIIYSRINNVKSEFIVEDEDVIYKYVLKEADVGE